MGIRGKTSVLIFALTAVLIAALVPYGVVQYNNVQQDSLQQTATSMETRFEDAMSAKEDVEHGRGALQSGAAARVHHLVLRHRGRGVHGCCSMRTLV